MPANPQGARVNRGWERAVVDRGGYKDVGGASFCFGVRMVHGEASMNMFFLCYRRSGQGNGDMHRGKSICMVIYGMAKMVFSWPIYTPA